MPDNKNIYKEKIKKILLVTLILFAIVLGIGFFTYKYAFKMSSVDAFFNTSLTITTVSVPPHERSNSEKMFTAIYALFSSLLFLSLVGAVVSYAFSMYFDT